MVPTEMELGSWGIIGGLKCGQQAGLGDLGNMANAMSNHPVVYMALFFLYKLYARGKSMGFRMN